MAISEKKPYESLNAYLDRVLPAELEAGKSRGKATAEIIFKFNEEKKEEPPFTKWGFAGGKGSNDIVATGGTITQDNDYKVHTFTSNGTFEIVSGSGQVEYLVQGGGGSGAKNGGSFGGGGAGGGIEVDTLFGRVKSYAVVVGAGGANKVGSSYEGNDGADSSLDGSVIGCGGEGGKSFTGGINCDFTATGKAGASNNSNATNDDLGPDGLFSSITGASTQYGRGGDSDNNSRTGVVGQGGHGGSGLGITSGAGADGIVITRYYSPAGAGDADADAYISAVKTAGGTLSAGDETAIQTLYSNLKTDSLYTKIKYMYPFMGGTADAHSVEGIQPTDVNYTISWKNNISGSSAHTSAGVDCTSNNGVGATSIAPNAIHSSVDDVTIGAYVSTAITNDQGFLVSAEISDRYNLLVPFDGNNVYGGIGLANFAIYDNGSAPAGRWYASRTSSTDLQVYKNGSSVVTNTTSNAGANLPSVDMCFFNIRPTAPFSNPFNGVCGFIFGADGLNGTEISTLDGHLSTFLTAIGR